MSKHRSCPSWHYPPFQSEKSRKALIKTIQLVLPHTAELGLLVGDDCSGRIPTLALRHAINLKRGQAGDGHLPTLFINGSIAPSASIRPIDATRRTLIMTEYIDSGRSIDEIIRALGKAGLSTETIDVAAIAAQKSGAAYVTRKLSDSSQLLLGTPDEDSGLFYYGHDMWNGVIKYHGNPHSRRIRSGRFDMPRVRAARHDAEQLGAEAYEAFVQQQQPADRP